LRTFKTINCDLDFVFKTWIGGDTRPNQWCSQPLFTGNQRSTVGSIVIIGEAEAIPTSGSFDLMCFFKDESGNNKFPGSISRTGFADIAEYCSYGTVKGVFDNCFSIALNIQLPSRCDGFLFYNGLDVSVKNIRAAYVPYVTPVIQLKGEKNGRE